MSANERRLLSVFVLLLLVFASIFGIKQLGKWSARLGQQEHAIELRKIEADALLAQADYWKQSEAWLKEQQPSFESESETTQELLDFAVKEAAQAGVTITNKQYQKTESTAWYSQFGVTLTVKGKLPEVFRWVNSLQNQPSAFRVIPFLKVTPDKDDAEAVLCSLQCWRWYQPHTDAKTTS